MTTTQLDLKDAIKAAIAESMGDIIKSSASATKRLLEKDIEQTVEKKVKLEETPTFKRKYNESQYKHSKEMEKIVNKISDAIDNNNIERAKEMVKEGKNLLTKRQKLIKIADREDDGWEVIKCYESDVLASDSDDEKRLAKSRRQARINKKDSRAKRLNYKQSVNMNNNDYKHYKTKEFTSKRKEPICYYCGREGHMQYACPVKRNNDFKGRN